MHETVRSVEPQIVELINRTIHETMDQFGLRSIEVRAGEHHDGDPVIFVEAQYDLSERPFELGVTGKLASVIRRRLRNAGEMRFPHIRNKFHEEQTVQRTFSEGACLIVTARRLVRASPTKPRQAELKRAVSTAYYALFHALAKDAANQLIGAGQMRASEVWVQVYRALDHGFAKSACREVRRVPAALLECADEFIELREARHKADYDPRMTLTRVEALEWALRAELAIAKLRSAPRRDRKGFAVQLLLKKRS